MRFSAKEKLVYCLNKYKVEAAEWNLYCHCFLAASTVTKIAYYDGTRMSISLTNAHEFLECWF